MIFLIKTIYFFTYIYVKILPKLTGMFLLVMSKVRLSKTLFWIHKLCWNKELRKQRPKRALESFGIFFLCRGVKLGNTCMETKMGLGHGEKKGGFPFGDISIKQEEVLRAGVEACFNQLLWGKTDLSGSLTVKWQTWMSGFVLHGALAFTVKTDLSFFPILPC